MVLNLLFNLYFGNFVIVDLSENEFEIKCVPNFYKLFKNNNILPENLKIVETSYKEVYDLGEMLNMNFGYCTSNLYWKNHLGFQKKFKQNIYKILLPKRETGDFFGIVFSKDFLYKKLFNTFLLKIYSGGLNVKWAKEMWAESYIKKLQSSTENGTKYLILEDFRMLL